MIIQVKIKGVAFKEWLDWMNIHASDWRYFMDEPPENEKDPEKQYGPVSDETKTTMTNTLLRVIKNAAVQEKPAPVLSFKINVPTFMNGFNARHTWKTYMRVVG